MPILPSYDDLHKTPYDFKHGQIIAMAIVQYFVGTCLVLLFIGVCCNFWWFIIRQGKYKVHPLLVFYILALLVTVSRFYRTIWHFTVIFENQPIGLYAPPTFKTMLGLEQGWIMIELCMRIRTTTGAMASRSNHESLGKQSIWVKRADKDQTCIKIGRVAMTIFIVVYCTVIFVYFSVATDKVTVPDPLSDKCVNIGEDDDSCCTRFQCQHDYLGKGLRYVIVPMLLVAFVMQSIGIGYLLYYTKRQQRLIMAAQSNQEQENTAVFSKENSTLAIILIIFDSTYLCRAVWDSTQFGLRDKGTGFAVSMCSICLGLIFDIIPIALILLFHYQNFSVADVEHKEGFDENQSPRMLCDQRSPKKLLEASKRVDTGLNLSVEERRESNMAGQSHVSVNFLICEDDSVASQFDENELVSEYKQLSSSAYPNMLPSTQADDIRATAGQRRSRSYEDQALGNGRTFNDMSAPIEDDQMVQLFGLLPARHYHMTQSVQVSATPTDDSSSTDGGGLSSMLHTPTHRQTLDDPPSSYPIHLQQNNKL